MNFSKYLKSPPARILALDFWRGLAVLGMIIFHTIFLLNFLGHSEINLSSNFWLISGHTTRFSFIFLVGISLALSSRQPNQQVIRGLQILSLGLAISLTTFALYPNQFVQFGILHLIGTSIILASYNLRGQISNLLIATLIFSLSFLFGSSLNLPRNYLLTGLSKSVPAMLDYFPILPWSGFVFLGIGVGNFFSFSQMKKLNKKLKKPGINLITLIGQKALLIYIVHIPIIYGAIIFLENLKTS